jgi:hypothetical protein
VDKLKDELGLTKPKMHAVCENQNIAGIYAQ